MVVNITIAPLRVIYFSIFHRILSLFQLPFIIICWKQLLSVNTFLRFNLILVFDRVVMSWWLKFGYFYFPFLPNSVNILVILFLTLVPIGRIKTLNIPNNLPHTGDYLERLNQIVHFLISLEVYKLFVNNAQF